MTPGTNVGVRAFMSYTRADNTDFNLVVDRLKREIEGRFHAATGRRLEIFLDRESIGWGTDWRGEIRDSVKSATLFLPVVTMRYFESDACRDELFAFHDNAQLLGVTDLILPIVLTGSDVISVDDPRREVTIIESLNYKNIESAWLSGYESSEWLLAINWMVTELKKGIARVEEVLSEQEQSLVLPEDKKSGAIDDSTELGTEADVTELNTAIAELTSLTGDVGQAIGGLGNAAKSSMDGLDLAQMPPKQQQVALIRVARALHDPAIDLLSVGTTLETKVGRADALLRAVVEELRSIDADIARDQVDVLLASTRGLDELGVVVEQVSGLVGMLRFAALTNVSLRKSLQPAISGLQSLTNAIAVVEGWRVL